MRTARALLWCIATAVVPLGLATAACGASDDGGPDASESDGATGREGSAFDAGEAEPSCDPTANLFAKVADAAIADGASTTGVCLGCAKAECAIEITQCTSNCACQSIVGDAVGCYVTTQQLGCAGKLTDYFVTQETRKDALQLLGCVRQQCPAECAIDAGADAATD